MKRIFYGCLMAVVVLASSCKSKDKKEPGDDDMDDMTRVESAEGKEAIAMNSKGGYGIEITKDDAVDIKQLTADPALAASYKGKISGVVTDRCKAAGCWVTLDMGNGETMMVQFRDASGGEFFVPQDYIGKNIVVSGAMESSTMSVEEQKHLAEDAGKSGDDITEAKKQLIFEADGAIAL